MMLSCQIILRHRASSTHAVYPVLWRFWISSRFRNHPWKEAFFGAFQQRYIQLTRDRLLESSAWMIGGSQGTCTTKWQPHVYRFWLGTQKLSPIQNLPALLFYHLNWSTDFAVSSLYGISYLSEERLKIEVSGRGNSGIVVEAKLCQPFSCISSDQILGIRIPNTAILLKKALLWA